MMRGRPARRRQQMLAYIDTVIARDGMAPSYAMIRRDLGFHSDGNVRLMVLELVASGDIKRAGTGKVRRIRRTGLFPTSTASHA